MNTRMVPASFLQAGNILVIEGEAREVVGKAEGVLHGTRERDAVAIQLAGSAKLYMFDADVEVAIQVTEDEF